MITPGNVLSHEIIGLDVRVVSAANPTHTGTQGVIIDETRQMLGILTTGGRKSVPKKGSVFRFTLPGPTHVEVAGDALIASPERRTGLQKKNQR